MHACAWEGVRETIEWGWECVWLDVVLSYHLHSQCSFFLCCSKTPSFCFSSSCSWFPERPCVDLNFELSLGGKQLAPLTTKTNMYQPREDSRTMVHTSYKEVVVLNDLRRDCVAASSASLRPCVPCVRAFVRPLRSCVSRCVHRTRALGDASHFIHLLLLGYTVDVVTFPSVMMQVCFLCPFPPPSPSPSPLPSPSPSPGCDISCNYDNSHNPSKSMFRERVGIDVGGFCIFLASNTVS